MAANCIKSLVADGFRLAESFGETLGSAGDTNIL